MTPLQRTVADETLDALAADDPAARHSRRDLQRLHHIMGTCGIIVRGMRELGLDRAHRPLRILELGAGDGSLMLRVARRLAPGSREVHLELLDRQALLTEDCREAYAALGWTATQRQCDVLDWMREPAREEQWDLIVANLFLHHFEEDTLGSLMRAIAARSRHFFACEPRRARLPLAASHLVGVLGANAVTRQDAVLSVRAGFRNGELSALWPATDYPCREYAAGLFSHCLRAARRTS